MLVSCVMPTADRRDFAAASITAFMAQTYTDTEFLILDCGVDKIADLIPSGDPRFRYWQLDRLPVTGTTRNVMCEQARGEVVIHWDDDDWHGPARIATQVAGLVSARADIGGLSTIPFLTTDGSAAWDYVWESPVPWVYGATFAYRRDFWARRPFKPLVSEDSEFVFHNPGRVLAFPANDWFVARVHDNNTVTKRTDGPHWRPRDPEPLKAMIAGWGGGAG